MKSSIVVQPQLRAATVRHVGPYHEIGKAFGQLHAAVAAANLAGQGSVLIGIYYDDPETTPAEKLRSDAGVLVQGNTPIPPALTETLLPGGRYLHARYLGAYDGLPVAWARLLGQGLSEHSRRRNPGPAYELYPNTPETAETPDLITDIYIPVR